MATYPPTWAPIHNHRRFKSVPRTGYAAKLAAAHTAALEQAPAEPTRCPETTKKGQPCKGMATETGFCAGHSRQRGLL